MDRKIVEYKIVWWYDCSSIENNINEKINGWWELQWNTFASKIPLYHANRYDTKQLKLCQAMVRYEDSLDK